MTNLRWMWSHIRSAKLFFCLAIILMALESMANLTGTWLLKFFFDELLFGDQSDKFWPLILTIGIAFGTHSLLFTVGPHFMHRTLNHVRRSMCTQLMNHMYRLPVSRLRKARTGSLVFHFTNDLHSCAWVASGDPPKLAQLIASLVFVIVILGSTSPLLLVGIAIFSVVYAYFGMKFAVLRKSAFGKVNAMKSELIVQLEEGVSSTREVVAFHNQTLEQKKYNEKFKDYYNSVLDEAKVINRQTMVSDPLKWGAVIFVILYGGLLVLNDQITVGLFFISYQFTSIMMESFNGIYQFFMDFSGKMSSVERIRSVLDGEKVSEEGISFQEPITSLAFHNVVLREDNRQVLTSLNFRIYPAGKTALVGPSGSGKTTAANLLLRFYDPTDGELRVNGISLNHISRMKWLNRITIVFQESYFFPDTIRNNLIFGQQHISENQMISYCKAMLIHDVISELPDGYDTVIGERGVTLSGGERQRLALARALIQKKDILILDESTSALDTLTEKYVMEQIDWMRSGQITIIIAHRLSTIQNANHIVVFDQGSVIEQGRHQELIGFDSLYSKLIRKQQDVS